ncbi:lantibiotic dehydratase [Micromonospora sp. NPDC023956]|uniref:lantibiotic dehydratase n=1 Tax=Micromonospora sp. NPDC023956 TaxID=3155722 RepID=UPI0033C03042
MARLTQPALAAAVDAANGDAPPADGTNPARRADPADGTDPADGGLDAAWTAAARRERVAIREIATTDRFRQAVTWQNPAVLDTAFTPLLAQPLDDDRTAAKRRSRERLVTSYWQRYCVKNDSIGFFGPAVWGRLSDDDPTAVRFRPGPALTDRQWTDVEPWAVDLLARELNRDRRLAPWLAPRRAPVLWWDGTQAALPGRRPEPVDPVVRTLLAHCDGRRPAHAVVALAGAELGCPAEDLVPVLDGLRRRRWLLWDVDTSGDLDSLDQLRALVATVDDPAVREPAADAVARLDRARREIDRDGTDADSLRVALDRAATTFTTLTGAAPVRRAGQTYGGRTLVVQDCRRDLRLTVGTDLLAALRPVDLLLQAGRWLTWQVRTALLERVREPYERVRQRGGGRPVDLASLWLECMPLLGTALEELVEEVSAEARRRWREVLAWPDDARRFDVDPDTVRPEVERVFAAPASGWSEGRYASPDFMIAASGPDAVDRGEFTPVLGELHLGVNSLDYACFARLHPDPDDLLREVDRDFPRPRLLVMAPMEAGANLVPRTQRALVRPQDHVVALTSRVPFPTRGRPLDGADLTVVEQPGGGWEIQLASGERFDLMEVFAQPLKTALMARVAFFRGEHLPRISFGRLVVVREQWRIAADELTFAAVRDPRDRYVDVRRWWRRRDLPARVFVKSPLERKPFHVDADSPALVELLCAAVRRLNADGPGHRLTISEMLPAPDECWLTDADGQRYTAELRLVAVDRADRRE